MLILQLHAFNNSVKKRIYAVDIHTDLNIFL